MMALAVSHAPNVRALGICASPADLLPMTTSLTSTSALSAAARHAISPERSGEALLSIVLVM